MHIPRHPNHCLWSWVALFPLIICACSTRPKDFETPKVSIANIAPTDMTLMEQ